MSIRLNDGERPIKDAPKVKLKNGADCIPQHYLSYEHSLKSVQKLVLECHYNEHYPIFVGEDNTSIYIQIGIVGYDNYKPLTKQNQKKIVYGRKWRVEPDLPTSEIIQTVFVALKKAKEHELRELFTLNISNVTTTPFSNHHDLPLMAKHSQLLNTEQTNLSFDAFIQQIKNRLTQIKYNHTNIKLVDSEQRKNGQLLLDLNLSSENHSQLPETKQLNFTLLLTRICINQFMYCLIEKLIQESDRDVEEHFEFKTFNRFSRKNSIEEIAELSLNTRSKSHIQDKAFLETLAQNNYQTDKNRAPIVRSDELAKKLQKNLSSFGKLDGVLPDLSTSQV